MTTLSYGLKEVTKPNHQLISIVNKLTELSESPACTICEYFVNEVEVLLSSNTSLSKINQTLEQDCGLFPSFVETCLEVVLKYTALMIKYIEQKETAIYICNNQFNLCDSGSQSDSTDYDSSNSFTGSYNSGSSISFSSDSNSGSGSGSGSGTSYSLN
ncbi:hypothetical protein RB653_000180 [Dictyostelium firmibasis]|uniref:Saposin B-type domain-containing protein n=1 Tax=Dictyostelium firmibasis TaxID=79012 RepID=A0AAN7U1W2_9MYCE